jgi:hypothetical protein
MRNGVVWRVLVVLLDGRGEILSGDGQDSDTWRFIATE